jgi:hypothetical protein
VLTLKLKDVMYQLVEEEKPDQLKHVSSQKFSFLFIKVGLSSAPTQITMFCEAKKRQSEYAGRPHLG